MKPKLHVFGHIHEARGAYVHRWKQDLDKVSAQNAIQLGVENKGVGAANKDEAGQEKVYSDEENLGDGMNLPFETPTAAADRVEGEEETIFVNAANSPSGPNARRTGMRVKMGGHGFQPIIVDLLE